METKTRYLSISKVAAYLFLAVIISLILCVIDDTVFKLRAIFVLNKYDEIMMTCWQVQATIGTLSIAVITIIVNRMDVSYYGLSLQEILATILPTKFSLNYWEMVLIIVLLNICSYIGCLFDSLICVSLIGIIEILIITSMIFISIKILVDPDSYRERVKKYIMKLLSEILKYPHHYELKHDYISSDEDRSLPDMPRNIKLNRDYIFLKINNMVEYLQKKISSHYELNLDDTYYFYSSIYFEAKSKGDTGIVETMNYQFNTLLRTAIAEGEDENIIEIFDDCINSKKDMESTVSSVFILMNFYYLKELSESTFQRIKEKVKVIILEQGIEHFKYIIISFLQSFILHADKDNFAWLIRLIWNANTYDNTTKNELFAVACAYIYYLSFKEPLVEEEKEEEFIKAIKNLVNISNLPYQNQQGKYERISLNKALTERLINLTVGLKFVFDVFDVRVGNWEYMKTGRVKSVHSYNDVIEFYAFYLLRYYKGDYVDNSYFATLTLEQLAKLSEYLDINGDLRNESIEKYRTFIFWVENITDINNYNNKILLDQINTFLKIKLHDQAQHDRENTQIREKKLKKLAESILDTCKKSGFYSTENFTESETMNLEYILPIENFSDHVVFFGFDEGVRKQIEFNCFQYIKEYFKSLKLELIGEKFESNYEKIIMQIENLKKTEIEITGFYNGGIFQYRNIENDNKIHKQFDEYQKSFKDIGRWENGYNGPVYVDESKFNICFSLNDNCVSAIDFLTDKEIENEMGKYKNGELYIYKMVDDTDVYFREEEFKEFLKIKLLKIHVEYNVQYNKVTCGFFTYFK